MKLNPYINFNGNCQEAFTFYKSVFGGEFGFVQKFKDVKDQQAKQMFKPEEGEKIMHISLPIGKETVLMGSDTPDAMGQAQFGNHITISVHSDSREEADKLFAGLSAGGQATMPMADAFWGDYFGMCKDKFGVHWMVNYHEEK